MKKMELLAPAGDPEGFRAVINAGCDAVYLGGKAFSARAYAGNFNSEELIKAIDTAHLYGVKVHLALNTLLKNNEIDKVTKYLVPLYEAGLDAVIIQDLGLIDLLHSHFPDLPLHASTQMSVTGPFGARFLKDRGIKRIIAARELSLDDIRMIKDETGMEVESFVHGSLCYSYSGKCLMSSIFGGRSGNRGRCAQPCRLSYDIFAGNEKLNDDREKYLLSPKDLSGIDILPGIKSSGVDSLKIEGRMKRAEYCAGVVSVYRKYIDLLESGKEYHVEKKDRDLLRDLYNREGFTTGYYIKPQGKELLSLKKERLRGSLRDQNALYADIRKTMIEKDRKTGITGQAVLKRGSESELFLSCGDISVSVTGAVPEKAEKKPVDTASVKTRLLKTGNTPFEFAELSVDAEEGIFINIRDINELRRKAIDALRSGIVNSKRRVYAVPPDPDLKSAVTLPAGSYGRRELQVVVQNIKAVREVSGIPETDKMILDISGCEKDDLEEVIRSFGNCGTSAEKWIMTPFVVKDRDVLELCFDSLNNGIAGVLVNDTEALGYFSERVGKDRIMAGPYLYTMNDLSREFIHRTCITDTVPYELNKKEIRGMDNSGSVIEVYGRIPLMITANVPMDAEKYSEDVFIRDRKGEHFPVKHSPLSSCNIIYNGRVTDLSGAAKEVNSLNVHGIRLSFTEEDRDIKRICRSFIDAYIYGKTAVPEGNYTKGHFNRGVE